MKHFVLGGEEMIEWMLSPLLPRCESILKSEEFPMEVDILEVFPGGHQPFLFCEEDVGGLIACFWIGAGIPDV